jgi:hypothetical protein
MTTTGLSEIDHAALERALEQARSESDPERARFDEMLARRGWQETAIAAAYSRQCATLRLKCWQAPPMHAGDAVTAAPCYGHRPEEIGLRRRLLACGLSQFEPDPIAALEAAEANRAVASNG